MSDFSDFAKQAAVELGSAVAKALGEGVATALEQGNLDAGFARMIEKLSDERLARKKFPDGRYIPPEG